ncbi:MFS general substrate transporter [Penicillium chermesinum]|nr:MFS general substrate transporter [Penicillium chermesinum]
MAPSDRQDVSRSCVRPKAKYFTDLQNGIVGWEGMNDPKNPNPFGSSVFAPGASTAAEEFHETSHILTTLSVSCYVLGYAVGPMFLSSLSELYGRRIILNVATCVFVLFQIGCALAPNISALIVFRTIAGMGGSACLTIGGGVVSDLFEPEQRGLAMSVFSFGPLFGPVIGPICGGFIVEGAGWRWIFWTLAIAGGTFTTFVMIFNRETNPTILIHRKTKRLQRELNRPDLRSCYDAAKSTDSSKGRFILRKLSMPLRLLFSSPIISIIALYISIIYGCLYLLFTTITGVFQQTYHWSIEISSLSYIGVGLGFVIGQIVFALTSDRIVVRLKSRNNNVFEPEMRLPYCIFFAVCVPISFFWYGWSVQARTHWIVPIIGLFPFGFGTVGIFGNLQTYLVDSYPMYAASAIAALTTCRSLFGALLPLAGPYMYEALGYGWGNSLLGFVTLAAIPMPLIFYRFGRTLRERAVIERKS